MDGSASGMVSSETSDRSSSSSSRGRLRDLGRKSEQMAVNSGAIEMMKKGKNTFRGNERPFDIDHARRGEKEAGPNERINATRPWPNPLTVPTSSEVTLFATRVLIAANPFCVPPIQQKHMKTRAAQNRALWPVMTQSFERSGAQQKVAHAITQPSLKHHRSFKRRTMSGYKNIWIGITRAPAIENMIPAAAAEKFRPPAAVEAMAHTGMIARKHVMARPKMAYRAQAANATRFPGLRRSPIDEHQPRLAIGTP